MINFICFAIAFFFVGMQLQLSELALLSRHYNYKLKTAQMVTYVAALVSLGVLIYDIFAKHQVFSLLLESLLCLFLWIIVEWLLARLSPSRLAVSGLFRLMLIILVALAMHRWGVVLLSPFVVMGIFFRNSPFGVVHGKPFWLVFRMAFQDLRRKSSATPEVIETESGLSYYNVAHYGIRPDGDSDVLPKLQRLVDEVGRNGGGTLFFPRGRYLLNKSGGKSFLQINHSHIILEGETDQEGNLLAELVSCGPTVEGHRNPWLSPFIITTGESLQPSNQFWGLNFRKPKKMHLESSSLSDPGSDGDILTPVFATRVVADAFEGSLLLKVDSTATVGKYVMLGMYNTTENADLLKDILGVDAFRPEWLTAHRAGEEQAPSFQWLIEVRRVIDAHTIELVRPLLRDCLLKYEPELFNVDMLEDIHIRHLRISSRWNGLFHHHGIPLYYTVGQAQEMDYGWNAINLKRVAHSSIEHVEIRNFTNPIYVQDSRNAFVDHVLIRGYDGHQGLKVYCHTCDCTFQNIDFFCHFADMMGGEGNAYANTFRNIRYLNPTFNPVDYDFHGFSEGPMSPPAYNLFENVSGFRYIKGAGATFMQPACAGGNAWLQCTSEGERRGMQIFYAMSYRVKSGAVKYLTAFGYSLVISLKNRHWSSKKFKEVFVRKLKDINRMGIPREFHRQFFPNSKVEQMDTTASLLE